jgi:hypothetical protein
MSDYNQFVMAVNKIYEITAKIKAGWKDQDNINIADSIEESKTTVVEAAKLFNTQAPKATPAPTQAPAADLTLEDDDEETGAIEE